MRGQCLLLNHKSQQLPRIISLALKEIDLREEEIKRKRRMQKR
jgi:hypothetical protein